MKKYWEIEADKMIKISEGKLNIRTRRNLLRLSAEHGIVWNYSNIKMFIKEHYGKTWDVKKEQWEELVELNSTRLVKEVLMIVRHEKLNNGLVRVHRKGRIAKTIAILGKRNKETVIYVRRETKSRRAGQTKLYLSNGKGIQVSAILDGIEII